MAKCDLEMVNFSLSFHLSGSFLADCHCPWFMFGKWLKLVFSFVSVEVDLTLCVLELQMLWPMLLVQSCHLWLNCCHCKLIFWIIVCFLILKKKKRIYLHQLCLTDLFCATKFCFFVIISVHQFSQLLNMNDFVIQK